ncbi:MAG: flavin reductase family protein [Armatimonadia bacterium]
MMMREVPVEEAVKLKYPEWVMFVLTRDEDGEPDIMPAGWCMICNSNPLMMAVAVGFGRYTHRTMEETGEFVLAWPAVGQEKLIEQAGSTTGRDINKFEEFGLEEIPTSEVAAPIISGLAVALECEVVSQLELEDHSIFVGQVVAAHVADPPVEKLENFAGTYAVARQK